jgi:hypothetical protein
MSLKKLCLAASAFALAATAYVTPSVAGNCPPPQHYSGVCIQVIVWAKDSNTGMCCQYSTPCAAPDGWQIFYGPNCTDPTIEGL